MKLLLDTHALVWMLEDSPRVGPRARAAMEDLANDLYVSIGSLWEIAIKSAIGKLRAGVGTIEASLPGMRCTVLPIEVRHLVGLATLPMHHRDPFDRLLIAQSIVDGLTLVSEDRNVRSYGVSYLTCSV